MLKFGVSGILFSLVVAVFANLQCIHIGRFRKELVCTAENKENIVLGRGTVSDNNRTTTITLRGCHLIDLAEDSLSGLPSLEDLDLSQNKINKLNFKVLDGTNKLKYLNLSYNELTELDDEFLKQNPNLEILDLKYNQIFKIDQGLFDYAVKLKQIDLSHNSIVGNTLGEDIFKEVTKLEFLDLSENDLSEMPSGILEHMKVLNKLILDGCFLKELPIYSLKNNMATLTHLSLVSNEIDKLDNPLAFKNLVNLEILNLSGNLITHINENVFKPMLKLKILQLRSNMLKSIPETAFMNIKKLGNLDLSHNKIEYIPVNAFRGTSLKNLNLSDNRFSYLTDNFCLELSNSGAKLTKFYFSHNPWQCSCLQQLLAEVKKYEIDYNNSHFDGQNPVCVTDNSFQCKRHSSDNDHFIVLYDNIKKV